MRRLLMIALLLLATSQARAADFEPEQIRLGQSDVLRGHFVEEKKLKGFNGPLHSEGHFIVAPKHGVIWGVEKPFRTTTVITPAGLAQSVDGKNVMKLSAQKIPFMLHLYEMLGGVLAGDWKALEVDFIVTKSDENQKWQITLSPKKTDNPAMPFSLITVRGDQFVEQVTLLKADGDSDTMTFSEHKISSKPPSESEKLAFNSVHP